MYNLVLTERFKKELSKLLQSNKLSTKIVDKLTSVLSIDPFDLRLRTHKVVTRNLGRRYSSKLTADLRVIWDFDRNKELVLLLLDVGGHEGNKIVYR